MPDTEASHEEKGTGKENQRREEEIEREPEGSGEANEAVRTDEEERARDGG